MPKNFTQQNVVRIVPTSGASPLLLPGFAEPVSVHTLPQGSVDSAAHVISGSPVITAYFAAPLPHVAESVFAKVEYHVPIERCQYGSHQPIRFHQIFPAAAPRQKLLVGA